MEQSKFDVIVPMWGENAFTRAVDAVFGVMHQQVKDSVLESPEVLLTARMIVGEEETTVANFSNALHQAWHTRLDTKFCTEGAVMLLTLWALWNCDRKYNEEQDQFAAIFNTEVGEEGSEGNA